MLELTATIRDYAWGSPVLLPALEGRAPTGRPEAEKWLGAHPGAPCTGRAAGQEPLRLDELIGTDPARMLGDAAQRGRLPFLMKLLAAGQPLSIQAHPTLERARAGFAEEEAAGVPADAPHRNYKDDNHKPEMIVALTRFAALCGFRRPKDAAVTFERIAQGLTEYADGDATEVAIAARRLAMLLDDGDVEGAFTAILDPASVWSTGGAEALVHALRALPDLVAQDDALDTAVQAAEHFPGDPGVLVTLLLNRVDLMPGQAIHLPAGNVHAYLHGLGVEVMAASDNVLRGGLTGKHVDVPELRRVVAFEPLPVPYTDPEEDGAGVTRYRPPFEEFELTRMVVAAEAPAAASTEAPRAGTGTTSATAALHGPAIAVATAGVAVLACGEESVRLSPGESVFLAAEETAAHPLTLRAAVVSGAGTDAADTARGEGEATVFVASLPRP